MAIFSDMELRKIMMESNNDSTYLDKVKDNGRTIKDSCGKVKNNIKKNVTTNIEKMKDNVDKAKNTKTKFKFKKGTNEYIKEDYDDELESLSEAKYVWYNNKSYKKLSKREEQNFIDNGDKKLIVYIQDKPYVYDGPTKRKGCFVLRAIGGVAGATLGTALGAAGGAVIGTGAGALAGGLTGFAVGTGSCSDRQTNDKLKVKSKTVEKSKRTLKIGEGGLLEALDREHDEVLNEGKININGKIYRKLKDKDIGDLDLKDVIEINGKKYIYDIQAHPQKFIGKTVGSIAGNMVGGPVGGFIGSTIGKSIGKETEKLSKNESVDFRDIYRSKEYTQIMNEYFDNTDSDTRKILLSINEEDQSKVLISLTSKLYESIVDRVDDIDFGEIPLTKGDITKLSNYDKMWQCIQTMRQLILEMDKTIKTDNPINTITTAINNIIDSTSLWKRAFTSNVEFPMVVYDTIVFSIINAVAYMVSMCIEFIKSPTDDSFQMSIDKSAMNKTKDHMLFDNLEKFNEAYRKGQVKSSMEYIMKENSRGFMGGLAIGGSVIAIAGLVTCIIPLIRELIFLFYYTRVRVSDYFELEANILQMNSYNIEKNRIDLDDDKRKKISSKQMKTADNFRSIANTIAIKNKDGEKKAVKEISRESQKKYKANEIMDEVPDSASSSSLF